MAKPLTDSKKLELPPGLLYAIEKSEESLIVKLTKQYWLIIQRTSRGHYVQTVDVETWSDRYLSSFKGPLTKNQAVNLIYKVTGRNPVLGFGKDDKSFQKFINANIKYIKKYEKSKLNCRIS